MSDIATIHIEIEGGNPAGGTWMAQNHGGYKGTGFADFAGPGSSVTLAPFKVDVSGSATLAVRYANGDKVNRPLKLAINGAVVTTLTCSPTKNWDTWADAVATLPLSAGSNVAVLTAVADGPNVDYVEITPPPAATSPSGGGTSPPPVVGNTTGGQLLVWSAIGACVTLAVDAKDDPTAIATVTKATSLHLTHLRSFGPACRTGGALDAGYANQVRRLTSRGIRTTVMHGAPQADPQHTTYDEDDWKRYFDGVAKARNNDLLYEIELQNELNLAQYWPLGGGSGLSTAAVAKMMAIVKIARAALGPTAVIIGPSIGWEASVTPHLLYQKAMLDAGLLDYVTAINTHLYFGRAQQVTDVLGQYRTWVGPRQPIYCTETEAAISLAKFAAEAPAVINAMHDANVVPFVYRLVPRGDNEFDDRALFDAKGNPNKVVCAAWGAKS